MPCYKRKLKKGIRYYFSGQYLNQKYHSKAIYHSKAECAKAERNRLQEIDEQARNLYKDIRLKDLFNSRLDYLKLTKNKFYYEDNKRHAELMFDRWGNIFASKVTRQMVNSLLMDELKRARDKKLTNSRPNALLVNARSFFNYGINKLDLDIKNPCKGIEKFSIDVKIKFIPTDEMLKDLLRQCNKEQVALIKFCDDTACRISEALRFETKDILDSGIVLYTRKSRNSNLIPRVLPLPDLPELPKKGRVFTTWTKRPRFLEEKTKGKWNWHSLRARRASIWASNREPLISIMSKLGHSNLSTTQRYLRLLGYNYS